MTSISSTTIRFRVCCEVLLHLLLSILEAFRGSSPQLTLPLHSINQPSPQPPCRAMLAALSPALTAPATSSRPLAVVLLIGPPGSGRTHACRALARHLCGTQAAHVKVDAA